MLLFLFFGSISLRYFAKNEGKFIKVEWAWRHLHSFSTWKRFRSAQMVQVRLFLLNIFSCLFQITVKRIVRYFNCAATTNSCKNLLLATILSHLPEITRYLREPSAVSESKIRQFESQTRQTSRFLTASTGREPNPNLQNTMWYHCKLTSGEFDFHSQYQLLSLCFSVANYITHNRLRVEIANGHLRTGSADRVGKNNEFHRLSGWNGENR
jgi:hypothetical protein